MKFLLRRAAWISITWGEWWVMDALWDIGEGTAGDIYDRMQAISPGRKCHRKTMMTFLQRLCHKKAVTRRKRRRYYIYRAVLERKDALRRKLSFFLTVIGNEHFPTLLKYYIASYQPGRAETAELVQIVTGKFDKEAYCKNLKIKERMHMTLSEFVMAELMEDAKKARRKRK